MLNIIANAEYRHGAENSTPKSYQKKAQKLFAELGENVEIVKIKCNYNSSKYHLFAFGEDVSKPCTDSRVESRSARNSALSTDLITGTVPITSTWSGQTGRMALATLSTKLRLKPLLKNTEEKSGPRMPKSSRKRSCSFGPTKLGETGWS